MSDLLAYEATDGSFEAFLFGPGSSSAYRNRDGIWTSPAPPITPEALAEGFLRLKDAEADTMNVEVVCALTDPEPQRPRATPAQLIEAAKDLRARTGAANAVEKARASVKKAAPMPPAPLTAFRIAAFRCAATMLESSSFINQELASVEAAKPHEQAIKHVCELLSGNWFDIGTELDELSELGLPDYSPSVSLRVDRIHQWLGEHLPELHGLVTALSSAAKDDPHCSSAYILVAESATNVLTAYAAVAETHERYMEAHAREGGASQETL